MVDHASEQDNPLQGYFDWQVNTIMLARDVREPLRGGDEAAHRRRRGEVEEAVRRFTLSVVPEAYRNDPTLQWPPSVMIEITRATLYEAARLAGMLAEPPA
ncbi:hypothetical protein [Phycisphaera mikurensis]|uniref:Uncharacterized protein n=1 Tax=Phycisphaera mikurensis (strain NBRC 102666 / KCTC 22515 / FYK2301M01) TaxID=1142394 RepID=I0IH19_PHYMF|nr:hypothetical protein [Phycisphaera mikurensis]MBB6440812.1 hypothetical protein [Phycisphaera mikurensis]BAM04557.1 hypothetical protein PSMK_23980 [Phycisphaera mikurensis NBRC 102666]